ncbi:MAG: hypothetical protein AAF376_08690 [Pseudomonadota bacterium]
MGESAEFEKLTMLEARLAAALDRISAGLDQLGGRPVAALEDPGITSAEVEEAAAQLEAAQAERDVLIDKVAQLEAQLAEATAGAGGAAAVSDVDLARLTGENHTLGQRVQALEAARTADADEAKRVLADRDKELSALREDLEQAHTQAQATPSAPAAVAEAGGIAMEEAESLADTVNMLTVRMRRMRRERTEALEERDALKAVLEEMQTPSPDLDARILALRNEVIRLRLANDDLLASLEAVKHPDEEANVVADFVETLISEIEALKTARASEAAEIERILTDLAPAVAQGGAHA